MRIRLFFGVLFCSLLVFGQQEDLLSELDSLSPQARTKVMATFKGNRIINGHSVELPAKGDAVFIISHRFGNMRDGAYTLFGFDQASIRIGLEYSPIENLCIGFGRSGYQKTVDGFVKYRFLHQKTGKGGMPLSMALLSSMAVNGLKWTDPTIPYEFKHRIAYTHQLMLARKFSGRFSMQIMPTMVHYNMVALSSNANQIYALGMGGRYKVHSRVALSIEAYPMLNRDKAQLINGLEPQTCIAFGLDIETGGHVFQLHVTNTQAMIEKGFIAESPGNIADGNLYFGFNISRVFGLH